MSFATTLATSTNPSTRTKTAILNKDVSKVQLVADLRVLAKRIHANPAVTPGQKSGLGLPIHAVVPTPTPIPATCPVLSISGKGVRTMKVRLFDSATPTKRAEPVGTIEAAVYPYLGAHRLHREIFLSHA